VHPDKFTLPPSLFRKFFWMHAASIRLVLIKLDYGLRQEKVFEDRELKEIKVYFTINL
jgi:hypothetical protein